MNGDRRGMRGAGVGDSARARSSSVKYRSERWVGRDIGILGLV